MVLNHKQHVRRCKITIQSRQSTREHPGAGGPALCRAAAPAVRWPQLCCCWPRARPALPAPVPAQRPRGGNGQRRDSRSPCGTSGNKPCWLFQMDSHSGLTDPAAPGLLVKRKLTKRVGNTRAGSDHSLQQCPAATTAYTVTLLA